MTSERVLLAMSGGVDSAVAAHLLLEQGREVSGVFMRTDAGEAAAQAAEDARRVAEALGIPLTVADFTAEFEAVLADFAAEYARGRTPNPCVRCNQWLKFGSLMDLADAAGARYVATGHHVRVVDAGDGPALIRAADRAKDQSYVLVGVRRKVLERLIFPIGEIAGKDRIRDIARRLNLPIADKPDSQDICFAADGRYTDLLAARAPEAFRRGAIVDPAGRVVGEHEGVGHFTIGQRRGLGVAAAEPMYVTAIDAATATVTIGPRAAACARRLRATDANWHAPVGSEAFRALVQIRYGHRAQPALVTPIDGAAFDVLFDEPVHAITPGQVAAVYDGDRLLGGGWIETARPGGGAS